MDRDPNQRDIIENDGLVAKKPHRRRPVVKGRAPPKAPSALFCECDDVFYDWK